MSSARAAIAALALLAGCSAFAQFTPPPAPSRWVTDTVGFISENTRRGLDARLERYERDTGRQVIVWIGGSLGDEVLEDWAARTFEAWGIGAKGKDDGVALFVFARDRKLRIEVGYGLEDVLPDLIASRIIQEEAVPRLRAGDPDAAMTATVSALVERLGGETSPPPNAERYPSSRYQERRPVSPGNLIVFAIVGVLFLILLITHPRLALLLLFSLMSGGGGRGGWGGGGGGGGFRGGGGRSGGGGASGSW
ncbi:MAG TPA: TPM domain-containing protein [Myxococcaceae bacterium]|nr:TPM domain-containing protein [Myxococcaceae bacterium]